MSENKTLMETLFCFRERGGDAEVGADGSLTFFVPCEREPGVPIVLALFHELRLQSPSLREILVEEQHWLERQEVTVVTAMNTS